MNQTYGVGNQCSLRMLFPETRWSIDISIESQDSEPLRFEAGSRSGSGRFLVAEGVSKTLDIRLLGCGDLFAAKPEEAAGFGGLHGRIGGGQQQLRPGIGII